MRFSKHELLFNAAQHFIPGGVNSPVRSFRSVGGTPIFFERGAGSRLHTVDGHELIDFCMSWGALLFGHADPEIVEAITAAARDGTSFGAATRREVEFAETLVGMVPSAEQVRCVSSGTEAVMTALRLARGATGRDLILKFDGCYHGHADAMLVAAGSGLLSRGQSSSAGVPSSVASKTLVAPYNDLAAVEKIFHTRGDDIAAIIVEPIAANMGLVPPKVGFLEGLRRLTRQYGSRLIFDEVITGFRFGPTTYGALLGIEPDITCLGKIIGGGLPLAALAGPSHLMRQLAPTGLVYQAGTLSGNPLAVAAGLTTLRKIKRENPHARLAGDMPLSFAGGSVRQISGAFTVFCRPEVPQNLAQVQESDTERFGRLFHYLLGEGIYLPPSQFETAFTSTAHTRQDLERLTGALARAQDAI